MSTERTIRLGYRGHLIEVTLERRPDGLWGAKWIIFATRPFLPKRQVVAPATHPSEDRARTAAVNHALRWIDAEMPPTEPDVQPATSEESEPLATGLCER
jgi:hypothetical protein